jgi:monoamine oxidase
MNSPRSRARVRNSFQRSMGASPMDSAYLEKDWNEEEWTRGCYGGNVTPGVLTMFGCTLRDPVGPLHRAGSETAQR